MRFWILSDLHLEHAPLTKPLEPPEADVCIIAGDLCRGIDKGVRWLAEHIAPTMPCIYVAGNHEFYKGSIKEGLEAGRAAAYTSWRTTPSPSVACDFLVPRCGPTTASRETRNRRWIMPAGA